MPLYLLSGPAYGRIQQAVRGLAALKQTWHRPNVQQPGSTGPPTWCSRPMTRARRADMLKAAPGVMALFSVRLRTAMISASSHSLSADVLRDLRGGIAMDSHFHPIRVVHYGLGATGTSIARLTAQQRGLQVVGGIERDPAKVGRDLGEVIGLDHPLGAP